MTEEKDDNKIREKIDDIFTNYYEKTKEKRANFRNKLEDKYCKKIYDKLLTEAHLKKQVIRPKFRYNEIWKLTEIEIPKPTISDLHFKHIEHSKISKQRKHEMSKPTLDLHLKHLEQKGFITKISKSTYNTAYQINITTEPKVIQIRKTILGKEKLELIGISKLKKGVFYLPPNLKLEPASDIPPKERLFYKD
jgi:DNA-binding transcriptional ArsR family regulator